MAPRWTTSITDGRRGQAGEIYWRMRSAAGSCREWLTHYCPAAKKGEGWVDIWQAAESTDLTLQMISTQAAPGMGYHAVCAALGGDDRLEGWLARIGAEMAYRQTGELAAMGNLSSSKPPGASHLAPDWAVERATDAAK